MQDSYSQLGQDTFVAKYFKHKKNGFFVEIGVGNGIHLSNTYLLEKKYNWKGDLCEANPKTQESIKINRTSKLETNAVYAVSNKKMKFNICIFNDLSGLQHSMKTSLSHHQKQIKETIEIDTISLNDLLEKHKAPKKIDYISLDTEGSEYEILSTFDFNKYKVKIWSIEHNEKFRSDGQDYLNSIKMLMEFNNYSFVKNKFDSYFINKKQYKIYS